MKIILSKTNDKTKALELLGKHLGMFKENVNLTQDKPFEVNINVKNEKEIKFQDRFDWTEEETNRFLEKYHTKITEEANFMPGAKKVLKMIKEEGHELIIISARGYINKKTIKITQQKFKENDLEIFSKYYWATPQKTEVCIKEKIDIMIDDSYQNCKSISEAKIKTVYLKDAPSYDLKENQYVKVLYNWGEIYRYINEVNQKEKNF